MSEAADEPAVLYEKNGNVVTITYNRPHRLNALNGAMRDGLNDAWLRFRDDEDAWVAIMTGAGKAFCAGADLRDGKGATGTFAGTFWEKPTINSFESGTRAVQACDRGRQRTVRWLRTDRGQLRRFRDRK